VRLGGHAQFAASLANGAKQQRQRERRRQQAEDALRPKDERGWG